MVSGEPIPVREGKHACWGLRGLSAQEKEDHPHATCVVTCDGEDQTGPVTEGYARRLFGLERA